MDKNWSVLSTRETTSIGPDGRLHDVVIVTARLDTGGTFTVDVPHDRIGQTDYVRGLVQAKADALAAIHDL